MRCIYRGRDANGVETRKLELPEAKSVLRRRDQSKFLASISRIFGPPVSFEFARGRLFATVYSKGEDRRQELVLPFSSELFDVGSGAAAVLEAAVWVREYRPEDEDFRTAVAALILSEHTNLGGPDRPLCPDRVADTFALEDQDAGRHAILWSRDLSKWGEMEKPRHRSGRDEWLCAR